jgi:hypothetical protein
VGQSLLHVYTYYSNGIHWAMPGHLLLLPGDPAATHSWTASSHLLRHVCPFVALYSGSVRLISCTASWTDSNHTGHPTLAKYQKKVNPFVLSSFIIQERRIEGTRP